MNKKWLFIGVFELLGGFIIMIAGALIEMHILAVPLFIVAGISIMILGFVSALNLAFEDVMKDD